MNRITAAYMGCTLLLCLVSMVVYINQTESHAYIYRYLYLPVHTRATRYMNTSNSDVHSWNFTGAHFVDNATATPHTSQKGCQHTSKYINAPNNHIHAWNLTGAHFVNISTTRPVTSLITSSMIHNFTRLVEPEARRRFVGSFGGNELQVMSPALTWWNCRYV